MAMQPCLSGVHTGLRESFQHSGNPTIPYVPSGVHKESVSSHSSQQGRRVFATSASQPHSLLPIVLE